ncbi:MAG: ABC transporter permease [Deltaproteobacteria bacterium]|nr:ABC transporter permease [Deltaproteobacteria bacterium]
MTSRHPLVELTLARVRLFYREPGVIFWTFGFPILITLALGIAFRNRPPEPVTAAIVSGPGASEVQAALSRARDVKVRVLGAREARLALRTGKVAIVVTPGATRVYELDPTRPESRLARAIVDDVLQRAEGRKDIRGVSDHHLTEPGARYVDFLVPGLIGLNIMSSGMWGIGYVIAETRTKKLLKRMRATPMRGSHYLLSFMLSRVAFLLLELPVLLVFAAAVFSVKVHGSLGLLVAFATLGALAFAGLGVLVASRARNTQTVTGLINLVMMPMFIGSGVFFSYENFPDAILPVLRLLPLTALNDGLRAITNEGAGLVAILPQIGVLAFFATASFVVGLKIFRWK